MVKKKGCVFMQGEITISDLAAYALALAHRRAVTDKEVVASLGTGSEELVLNTTYYNAPLRCIPATKRICRG